MLLTVPNGYTHTKEWLTKKRIFQFQRSSKIVHNDRNGHISSNYFHFDAMISSFAKVMGPQSRQKQRQLYSKHGKGFQHDRSDRISHTLISFEYGSL